MITRQLAANPIIEPNSGSKISKYDLVEKPLKTPNSVRKLKVPSIILSELERRNEQITANKERLGKMFFDNDYISCQDNGRPYSLGSFNNALTKICKKASLPT